MSLSKIFTSVTVKRLRCRQQPTVNFN
uniref:Uncharacterized protein n=1 Tax=Anguilla anguilla TaxID=7936 RepID=A0A0E9W0T7_ANGAN